MAQKRTDSTTPEDIEAQISTIKDDIATLTPIFCFLVYIVFPSSLLDIRLFLPSYYLSLHP